MKIQSLILVGCLLSLLTACGSVEVMVPAAQVESPDVPGVTKLLLGGGLIPGRQIKWSDDASKRPPIIGGNLEGAATAAGDVDLGAGLGRRFEISGNLASNLFDASCAGFMGKFQLAGQPAATATQGDFPIGVFAHWQACASYRDGDQNGIFGNGGYRWRANANANTGDVGLSAGYRFSSRGLLYIGGSYGITTSSVAIHQAESDDKTSAGGDYSASRFGNAASGALGIKFEWTHFSFEVKGVYTHVTLGGANPDALLAAGHFGFRF